MSTLKDLKDLLCLLAILVAYGIVGRMDYDDAVMLEAAQRAVVERTTIDGDAKPADSMPESAAWARQIARDTPSDSAPCRPEPDTLTVE